MQSKRHSKRSSSHSSCNVITKYFRSEIQAANASSSESSLSDNLDVILIESDDKLTEIEDTMSAKSTHSLCSIVASTRDTVVNTVASSSVGSDSGANHSMSELSHMHSKTVSNDKSSAKAMEINDIGIVIQEGMSVEEVLHAVLALSPCQKYSLLIRDFCSLKYIAVVVIDHFSFPGWRDIHGWCGFCKYCSLFVKDRNYLGALVNWPFRKWVKVNKIVEYSLPQNCY